MDLLHYFGNEPCSCGKVHTAAVEELIVEKGAIKKLPECIRKYQAKKVFLFADGNTWKAAGEAVAVILADNDISYSKYIFPNTALEPDEAAVGAAVMHFDHSCDMVIGIGSGVINDISKILSKTSKNPYIIVATAPSMDGYASATSSMSMDGLKVSLPSRCANVIIGDIDILSQAPEHLLQAGLGDMIAKYVSICEWRIANIITGEYYCEEVAKLVRTALKKCVDNAEGLLKRDEDAIKAVFEGLVIGGIAMAYAGVSRPASGVEHYFSHIWDMRGLEFGTKVELHGIQCAVGTVLAARLYEQVKKRTPDKEKALQYAEEFDYSVWSGKLRKFLGKGADAMIALEAKEQKYDGEAHAKRLDIILDKWEDILAVMEEELLPAAEVEKLLDTIGAPKTPESIGIDPAIVPMTFQATKDIRDKYVLSRLAWDLGIIDELSVE